jgi:hypothetical protein
MNTDDTDEKRYKFFPGLFSSVHIGAPSVANSALVLRTLRHRFLRLTGFTEALAQRQRGRTFTAPGRNIPRRFFPPS